MDQENILVLCREIDKLRRENQILKQEALQSRMERAICDDHLSKQMMNELDFYFGSEKTP